MAQGKAYPDETRAAIIASLLAGQGVNKTAREFGVSRSVVSRFGLLWKHKGQELGTVKRKKPPPVDDLVYSYLETLLVALIAQAKAFSTPGFVFGQTAREMAKLHGELSDRAFKLLSCSQGAQNLRRGG